LLRKIVKSVWGYDALLPLQQEAMQCVLDDRDSLVVMPTGGGKSLCYQAPALCRDGLAIVVSPLISLMKDQVDALARYGVPAAAINSSMAADERRSVARRIERGQIRMLYLSPERLLAPRTVEYLQARCISFFAIDEAHCISAWGHDFRPEYRDLSQLRESFPKVAIHAYTATATQRVREDIARQLGLRDPQMLVGDFRRPNLHYYVQYRQKGVQQVCRVLDKYRGQPAIVYCISRAAVEKTCQLLRTLNYSALPYHAGMSDRERTRNQNEFIAGRTEIMVATIAFGMGIDKPDVRAVIHAGMPKSLENYQQETGRAGRDGERAECWLLYSAADLLTWKRVIAQCHVDTRDAALQALDLMYTYCNSVSCRHASLVAHFGQSWSQGPCQACDVCLQQLDVLSDAVAVGQIIVTCVLQVDQRFGADYISQVLSASREPRILANGHHQLSSWGGLAQYQRRDVRRWIEQLVGQRFLCRTGEFSVLQVTREGHRLLQGAAHPVLLRPTSTKGEELEKGSDNAAQLRAVSVQAFPLFDQGLSIAEVAERLQRSPATICQYLVEYIEFHQIGDATRWISAREFEQVKVVVQYAGGERLKPVYEALHGRVSYDTIRIALACLKVKGRGRTIT
jgi:ATP-dependent DNA helicase RecQ